jgi:hypothetical protein
LALKKQLTIIGIYKQVTSYENWLWILVASEVFRRYLGEFLAAQIWWIVTFVVLKRCRIDFVDYVCEPDEVAVAEKILRVDLERT